MLSASELSPGEIEPMDNQFILRFDEAVHVKIWMIIYLLHLQANRKKYPVCIIKSEINFNFYYITKSISKLYYNIYVLYSYTTNFTII